MKSRLAIFPLVGAVLDAAAAVILLSPRVASLALGIDVPVTRQLDYAMQTGGALMIGWTVLLVWTARRPVERRAVMLFTIFPVVTGLAIAEVLAVRAGLLPIGRAAPLLGVQVLLSALGLWTWREAGRAS